MKPTSIVLLLVALIAGGLAAFLATQQSGPVQVVQGPTEIVQEQKTQVLVAIAPIGVGQRLSGETVQWRDWPAGAVRDEYITIANRPDAMNDVTGAVARFEIFPGDPVIEQKLVRTGQGYLSAVLDRGKRGISVAVEPASASGGFIVPNDHVDVVSTRNTDMGMTSETIVRNVKVLAINARLGETGATGGAADPANPNEVFQEKAIATLELDPAEGEAVINAALVGTISLSLRSIADFGGGGDSVVGTDKANVRLIRFGANSTVVAGQPSDAPSPDTYSETPADPDALPVVTP